jgi:hypothetical protein
VMRLGCTCAHQFIAHACTHTHTLAHARTHTTIHSEPDRRGKEKRGFLFRDVWHLKNTVWGEGWVGLS